MRVVVVGAGLSGCSVAWHLALHAQVILVDAGARPGSEASSQNAGMVRRMGEDPAERALAMRTVERLSADDGPFAGTSRVCGAVLGLAHDRWHLHDARAHLAARGVRVVACDRPSQLAPALVGSPLPFAWWLPDERVADVPALLNAFLSRVTDLRLQTRVTSLLRSAGRVTGVRTTTGDIEADAVVLAAGAWSGALGGRPLTALRRALWTSAPDSLSTDSHPWVWVDDAGVYARPHDGAWWVSTCDERAEREPTLPGSTGPMEPCSEVMGRIDRYLPPLSDLTLTGGWSGLRTFSPDRRPLLGADDAAPGLWWAAGLGGFGVTCSVAVGEALAAWMTGHAVDWLDPDSVSPSRPQPDRWPVRTTGVVHEARLVRVRHDTRP